MAQNLRSRAAQLVNDFKGTRLARYDRWKVLLYTLASAAAFWIIINPPWKIVAAHYSPGQWLFLFVFSMTSVLSVNWSIDPTFVLILRTSGSLIDFLISLAKLSP